MPPPTTKTSVVLLRGERAVARWVVEEPSRPGLEVVEVIARMQVQAHRAGCSIRVEHPTRELRELLELAGLTDVVPMSA